MQHRHCLETGAKKVGWICSWYYSAVLKRENGKCTAVASCCCHDKQTDDECKSRVLNQEACRQDACFFKTPLSLRDTAGVKGLDVFTLNKVSNLKTSLLLWFLLKVLFNATLKYWSGCIFRKSIEALINERVTKTFLWSPAVFSSSLEWLLQHWKTSITTSWLT